MAGSPATSAGPGRWAGGRSDTVTRPWSRFRASGPSASARASISRTFGSCSAIAARSPSLSASTCSSSASSISVASNRSPWLSGAICGWSGSTIVAPSTVSSFSLARTGKMLMWSQAATAAAALGPGATGEAKRPPGRVGDEVRGAQRRAQRPRAIQPLGHLGRVVHAHRDPHEPALERRRGEPDAALHVVEGELDRRIGLELDPALAALLEEGERAGHRLAGLEHELHPRAVERVRRAGRVDRRVDDPERRRRRVLGRARRVRVERVALVEQRGEQALDAHSSSRTVSSNVCRPRSALRRASASSVSRWRRIQPPPG